MQTQIIEYPFATAEELDIIAETINSAGFRVIIRTNLPLDGQPLREGGKYHAEVKYSYDEGKGNVLVRRSTFVDMVGPGKWVVVKTHAHGASFRPEAVAETMDEIVANALVLLKDLAR